MSFWRRKNNMEPTGSNCHIIELKRWISMSFYVSICIIPGLIFLGWSHHYKNSTVVITIWLTITKYPYLKITLDLFSYICRLFLSSITKKTFTGLDYMSNGWVSYQKQALHTLREHLSSHPHTHVLSWDLCCSFFKFSVLCCVFVSLCPVSLMPVSLHCPFLIAHSVFSNVYLTFARYKTL